MHIKRVQKKRLPSQRTSGIVMFGLILIGVVVGAALTSRGSSSTDAPISSARNREGRELYVTYCASCHGVNLEGQPNWRQPLPNGSMPAPPHDATGHTWHHPDDFLFRITKEGGQSVAPQGYVSGMPAFGSVLSDDQIWMVLEYIKSAWPPDVQEFQRRLTQQGG
ncbi:c-type cytochrome [Roseiflexus castenholzii]|jgi:mono/diheme cytochrome c family protein|uniref:Cytochrome c class I n=1 Tax=Roseiflexus castenholzii (strain DSM 13941 / HLO8) TaxID=383372 RepID=A7NMT0_ROSCS|nr:cytochrome c [Roseiflexus castenholzii]ABU58851.1 cytochrome c class I [Roseiflexus castenholzii DSM 13941]